MADELKTPVETAEKAAAKTVETVRETAEKAGESVKVAAEKTASNARKAVKTTTRRVKAKAKARRAPKIAQPATKERKTAMNFDKNNLFAGFGAFPANPFQNLLADAGERGQEAVRRSQKIAEQMADLTRANVEALTESGRIAAEGARSLGQDVVETGRENMEQAADAVRSLAEAKSATEFVQRQGDFARASFDRMVSEGSRLTESFVKLAGEAFQPISSRASLNAEKINSFVA